MSMKIPYCFNKMVVYKRPSGPAPVIPLTFENVGTVGSMTITYNYQNAMYSKNDGEWTSTPQTIDPGDKVAISSDYYNDTSFGDRMFSYSPNGDPQLKVYGSLMSVYNWQDTPPAYGFSYTFDGFSYVCDASELVLPPYVNNGCYVCMFESNSTLTAAPSIFPALTVGGDTNGCYQAMFKSCSNLVKGPDLIAATTVSGTNTYAMDQMFVGCSSLSTGVELLITDIVDKTCFVNMFSYCSNLPWVKVHFTTWDINSTYSSEWGGWLINAGTNVSPIFYKPVDLIIPSPRDGSSVPTNWQVVNNDVPPIPTANLIWLMDFSNGLVQPYSQIQGTNNDASNIIISSDSYVGTYLHANNPMLYSSVSWTGSQQYLANLLASTDPFTISFWMKTYTYDDGGTDYTWDELPDRAVINFRGGDTNPGVTIYGDNFDPGTTNTKINCRTGYNYWTLTQTDAHFNQNWNHWTYTRDSNGGNWYLNGVLNYHTDQIDISYPGQVPPQQADVTPYSDMSIGMGIFDVTKYRIYNRALTSAQVNALYVNRA